MTDKLYTVTIVETTTHEVTVMAPCSDTALELSVDMYGDNTEVDYEYHSFVESAEI